MPIGYPQKKATRALKGDKIQDKMIGAMDFGLSAGKRKYGKHKSMK